MANYYDIPSIVLEELRDYFKEFEGFYLCTDTAELVGNAWQCMMDRYEANVDDDTAAQILNSIGIPNIREFEKLSEEIYPHHFCFEYRDAVKKPLEWLNEALGVMTLEFMDYIFYGNDITDGDSRIALIQTQLIDEADEYLFDAGDVEAVLERTTINSWKANCKLVNLLPTQL